MCGGRSAGRSAQICVQHNAQNIGVFGQQDAGGVFFGECQQRQFDFAAQLDQRLLLGRQRRAVGLDPAGAHLAGDQRNRHVVDQPIRGSRRHAYAPGDTNRKSQSGVSLKARSRNPKYAKYRSTGKAPNGAVTRRHVPLCCAAHGGSGPVPIRSILPPPAPRPRQNPRFARTGRQGGERLG